jgi:hypothetical protein
MMLFIFAIAFLIVVRRDDSETFFFSEVLKVQGMSSSIGSTRVNVEEYNSF